MNARDAHRLQPGDMVQSSFGTSTRRARIIEIDWPHFVVRTILRNGQETTQRTRYQSISADSPDARPFGR